MIILPYHWTGHRIHQAQHGFLCSVSYTAGVYEYTVLYSSSIGGARMENDHIKPSRFGI